MLRSGFLGSWSVRAGAILFAPLLINAFVAQSAYADWIHLKNGQKLQGKILREENGAYVLRTEVPKGKLRIRKERVKRIESEGDEDFTLDQARVKKGDDGYREALEDIREILETNPDSNRARRVLRNTYRKAARQSLRQDRLSQSLTYVEAGLEKFPGDGPLSTLRTKIRRRRASAKNLRGQARNALKNKKYDRAIALYNRARKKVPNRRSSMDARLSQAYAGRGVQQFRNEAFGRAVSSFRKAVSIDSDRLSDVQSVWIHAVLKRAGRLLSRRKYRDATSMLTSHLERFPDQPRLTFMLGTAFQYRGRMDRAVQLYSSLLDRSVPDTPDLGKLRKDAADAADVSLTDGDPSGRNRILPGNWRKKKTEHFTIFHRNHEIADRAAKALEQSLKRARSVIRTNALPDDHTRNVYIYPTKKKYRENADMPDWSSGYTQTKYASGERQFRILTYQKAPRLTESVLPHEVGHVVFGSVMGRRSLPLWLEEGVAVYFEDAYSRSNDRIEIRAAHAEDQLPSLETLFNRTSYPSSRTKKSLFYAQSYSIVHFLLKQKGWKTLIQLGKTIHPNDPGDAIEELYGFGSVDELEKTWLTHLKKN